MSKIEEIRENAGVRSKALLNTVADILESITRSNLAVADDLAGFAVAQVRLPTQADDFSDYRERSKDAFARFGTELRGHGKGMIEVLREVPTQVRESLTIEEKAARPAKAGKAKTKSAASRKSAARKAPKKAAKKATAAAA